MAGGAILPEQRLTPPSVYVSKGACPFECCRYGKWAATRPLALLDRPGGHPVAKLSEGEQVLAITGEVITHSTPSRIRGDGAYNEGIPAGAVVCLLHPVGEGDWLAWYKGKVVQIEAYDAPDVDYHWWAKIKKASDRVGWVPISALALPFTGADSCG